MSFMLFLLLLTCCFGQSFGIYFCYMERHQIRFIAEEKVMTHKDWLDAKKEAFKSARFFFFAVAVIWGAILYFSYYF